MPSTLKCTPSPPHKEPYMFVGNRTGDRNNQTNHATTSCFTCIFVVPLSRCLILNSLRPIPQLESGLPLAEKIVLRSTYNNMEENYGNRFY